VLWKRVSVWLATTLQDLVEMRNARIVRLIGIGALSGTLVAPMTAAQAPQQKPAAQPPPAQKPGAQAPTQKPTAQAPQQKPADQASRAAAVAAGVQPPAGYVIGVDDLLTIRFWSDTQLSTDATVRTDGKISVPLLNDIQAAGLTPEELGDALEKAASKFVTEPDATVIVREIRSRKVFVIGQGVTRAGVVPLTTDMNVLQVLAAAGGLLEYADKNNIVIIRNQGGKEERFKFNYDDVVRGKNAKQNIPLRPGDTVVVN
jgi:polysaccharide export outer membrane protein